MQQPDTTHFALLKNKHLIINTPRGAIFQILNPATDGYQRLWVKGFMTCAHTHTHSRTHTLTYTLTHTYNLTHTHTLTHAHTLTYTHAYTITPQSHTYNLTHIHSRIHTITHTNTLTHTHTHTHRAYVLPFTFHYCISAHLEMCEPQPSIHS